MRPATKKIEVLTELKNAINETFPFMCPWLTRFVRDGRINNEEKSDLIWELWKDVTITDKHLSENALTRIEAGYSPYHGVWFSDDKIGLKSRLILINRTIKRLQGNG